MKNKKKIAANKKGWWGEIVAAIFLLCKGYKIVARRYKTKVGEIDIIAKKGNLIIFVEVKVRKSVGEALDAISYSSQRRIENAANWWTSRQKHANMLSWRFDVVAIVPYRLPQHFENVW